MKARELFEDRFNNALKALGINNIKTRTFIIVPTSDEIKYSSFDDIVRFWQTPLWKAMSGLIVWAATVNQLSIQIKIWRTVPISFSFCVYKSHPNLTIKPENLDKGLADLA